MEAWEANLKVWFAFLQGTGGCDPTRRSGRRTHDGAESHSHGPTRLRARLEDKYRIYAKPGVVCNISLFRFVELSFMVPYFLFMFKFLVINAEHVNDVMSLFR